MSPTNPTPAQLAPILAASLKAIAEARNADAIAKYKQAVTIYYKVYGTNPSPSAPALPAPPLIETVNVPLVEALETASDFNDTDWLGIYTYAPYQPAPPPVVPTPTPSVVVGPFGEGFPGFFELSPDSSAVSVGTAVEIGGHQYIKEVVSESPFAPNGQVTAWKVQA